MDIGRALSFVFDDEEWISKILIGGLLQLIPIIGQIALIGYMFEVGRNAMQRRARPLPTWGNFGNLLGKGFAGFIISLVYALPIVLIVFVMTGIMFAVAGGAASTGNEDAAGAAAGFIGLVWICLIPVLIIVGLIIQVMIFGAWMRYIEDETLGAALQFGEVWSMVRNNGNLFLMLFLMYLLASIIAQLGSIACGIGVLFTLVYSQAAMGHALGQAVLDVRGPSGFDQPPSAPDYGPPPVQ